MSAVLKKLQVAGGGQIREHIVADYPNNVVATIVYDTDPEGNIAYGDSVELTDTLRDGVVENVRATCG